MNQKEKDGYIESIQNFTDRQLLELNTYHTRKSADYLKSIDRSMTFFLNLTIISLVIGIIVFIVNYKQ